MENIKNTPVMSTSMNINDILFMYMNAAEISKKHRESEEGIRLECCMRVLNSIAIELLDYYDDKSCCSKQNFRHFKFQCRSHKEYVIASYHRCDYAHLGMKQVEQFVVSMATSELYTFVCKRKTCPVASKFKSAIICILYHCMKTHMDNIYVFYYNKRGMAT